MPEIVAITRNMSDLYKEVRLRALQADPSAFCSTYAREVQFTDEVWYERSASLDGYKKIGFVAMEASKPCGLVACFRDEQASTCAHVISMWVAPSHRGTGLSSSLLDAIRKWAQTQGITVLRLGVISNNATAIKFYERYGFTRTGEQERYRNDASLFEVEMSMPTANTAA